MAEPAPPPGFVPLEDDPAPPPGFVPVPSLLEPAAQEPPGVPESFGRGAAEGAFFGFENKLGFDKQRREASKEANPWTHFMGEMTGAIAPMAASYLLPNPVTTPLAVARGAGLLARGAELARPVLAAARSALVPGKIGTAGQAMKEGAKLGVTYGGLSGAGHADVSPEDSWGEALGKRALGAGAGALTGAIAGPALGLVGHGLYRGAQFFGTPKATAAAETAGAGQGALTTISKNLERDRITPDELIQQIRSEFPDDTQAAGGIGKRFWGNATTGARQPITANQVEETVRRAMAGESAAEISAALSPGGKGTGPGPDAVKSLLDELAARHLGPLNLVDRASLVRTGAGENTQMTLRGAAATPGEQVGIARENLLERQIGAGGRLGQIFDRLLGSSDYAGVAARHAHELEDAGARAYSTAFANEKPFDLNPIFEKWTRKFQDARGPIPDSVRGAIFDMQSTQPVIDAATGQLARPNPGLINKAPPMNLQQFIWARQGLGDAIKQAKKDGADNLARQLTQFKDELSEHVASTNPDWSVANQLWRDGSAAEDALLAGARMTTRLNASSRENLAEFTDAQQLARQATKELQKANAALKKFTPNAGTNPADQMRLQAAVDSAKARLDAANSRQELFKVGVVRALNDMLANQGETHNLTRQLLLPGARKMLSTVLGKEADQFFKAVRAEQAMHRTYASQFGSQTTPLREKIDEMNWAPRVEASWYNPMHWPSHAINLATEYAARTINANRNKELMELYTGTDPLKQLDILKAVQGVHAARTKAGNRVGLPVVGASGPTMDALMSLQEKDPAMSPYRP